MLNSFQHPCPSRSGASAAWTLNQVQGDGLSGPSLLALEIDRDDVRPVRDRNGGRSLFLLDLVDEIVLRLEGELEVDRRILEAGDRGERDDELRRRLVEAQADLEAVVVDLEIPEAVLDDDRHLIRKAIGKVLRDRDARSC